MSNVIVSDRKGVLESIADRLNLDPKLLTETLKKTAFSTCKTNEQFVTMCVVANKYGLNPLTKEIYAFPDRNGKVVPVVGVDGWIHIVQSHPAYDGIKFEYGDGCCTCTIFRKDHSHPTEVTEFLEECDMGTHPWQKSPRRMLRNKALIQCARIAFGYSGIVDPDEADRIVDAQTATETAKDAPRSAPKTSLREVLAIKAESAPAEVSAPADDFALEADEVAAEVEDI